ncbi:MAG TPA: DUF177 domain-containing protein, partial [Armatimonadetes bacterium]|nr:DUF177 domain-containing protein [Armatimonadota bacterium]
MRLDLSEVVKHKGSQVVHLVEEPLPSEGLVGKAVSKARGVLTIVNTGRHLAVEGKVSVDFEFTCSRCLKRFSRTVEVRVEERFPLALSRATQEQLDDCLDGLTPIWQDEVLDVGELVRQYIELALPMAPLCRSDCKGICPTCGKDLNEGPCGCERLVDARLSQLRAIK